MINDDDPNLPPLVSEEIRHLSQHFVTLLWHDQPVDAHGNLVEGEAREYNASGFVMAVDTEWFLVTAGHVISDILQTPNEGRRITSSVLCDCWTSRPKFNRPLPLPIDASRCMIIKGAKDEADFGLIRLGSLVAAGLEANGIKALSDRWWTSVPKVFDFHLLMGTPGEFIKSLNPLPSGRARTYEMSASILLVEQIADPKMGEPTSHERFFGRLIKVPFAQKQINDIAGMSGGPIFGMKRHKDGTFDYWVVAIQSGWYKSQKIITGEFFPEFAAMVSKAVRKALREINEPE